MIKFKGISVNDNPNIEVLKQDNEFGFQILQFKQDLSVMPYESILKYFMARMDCRKRFVLCSMRGDRTWTLSAGAMNWMGGSVKASTGVKGVGDLFGKALKGKASGESTIKPEYTGKGVLATETTYKHLIPLYLKDWGGSVCVNDGYYYMSTGAKLDVLMIGSVSGAIAGGESLFNLCATGDGVVIVESPQPMKELVVVDIENDTFKIDGPMAVAWSSDLDMTVERVTKSLVGSAASGEGFVNVFRGTGRIIMTPFKEDQRSAAITI